MKKQHNIDLGRGFGGIKELGEKADRKAITVDASHPYFWASFILVGEWGID